MPRGFSYGNARLRARRSRLLTLADYERLLAKSTIEELNSALHSTPYQPDLEAAVMQVGQERAVFEASRRNLAATLNQVRTFYQGEHKALIDLLLRRWDRHNLLAILRGQSHKIPARQIQEALIPVGRLDAVSLRELARQPGLPAALDLMTAWRLPYARALQAARARIGVAPDLDQLELALNHAHYHTLLRELAAGNGNRHIVREWLCAEIDLVNIRTVLRLVRQPGISAIVRQRYEDGGINSLLVQPGGHVTAARLAQLVNQAAGLADVIEGLTDTRYAPALHLGWNRYRAANGSETMIERELERWQVHAAAALFAQNPLGIGIPIAFLACKEAEIANLRLIAQAVTLELDREAIKPDLILPAVA
jgi:V/A-type H+-transporting ATPase subunit C